MYNNHLQYFSVSVFQNDVSAPKQDLCVNCPHWSVFELMTKCAYVFRISCKDLKSMLSQVNYRVPNMRFLREKLPVTFCRYRPPPFLTVSAYFPFTAILMKACDYFYNNSSTNLSITGFRVEERRCVVQPVCPALSQPHVRCSEKCKCGHFICGDWSVAVLSSHITPSDALLSHPSPPNCLFSNDCMINMKKHTLTLAEGQTGMEAGWGQIKWPWRLPHSTIEPSTGCPFFHVTTTTHLKTLINQCVLSVCLFRWRSHFYRGTSKSNKPAHWISMHCYRCVLTKVNFSVRFMERPDQRISVDDFKSFLLDSQKVITLESWTCLLGGFFFIAHGRTSVFVYHSRKYGPQTATRFRNSCLATWKIRWEKWNSPISTKMR